MDAIEFCLHFRRRWWVHYTEIRLYNPGFEGYWREQQGWESGLKKEP